MRRFAFLAVASFVITACDAQRATEPGFDQATRRSTSVSTPVATLLDQAQTISDGWVFFGFSFKQAQTFTPGLAGSLERVDLELSRVGSPGDVTVEIRSVAAGIPSATVLATATIPEASISDTSFAWISVPFSPGVQVESGTQYAIVLSPSPSAPPCCDGVQWAASFANPYSAGTLVQLVGTNGSWTVLGDIDTAFKTFTTVPLTSKDQCKKTSWRDFPQFKNQGDCVNSVP